MGALDVMTFRSPPPHRHSRGNIGNALTKGGKPNKYTPHAGQKQVDKAAVWVQRKLIKRS